LPQDLKDQYGVDLDLDAKRKIIGGNIARLYGIDPQAKLDTIKDDDLARRHAEHVNGEVVVPSGAPGSEPPATETGLAGTESR
jgi:hypothetical protein